MARPRKKPTPRKTTWVSAQKKYIFAWFFLFIWILTLIVEQGTIFANVLELWLWELFWEYYKAIFAPVLILLGWFLIKEKDLEFNMYRAFWLLFYFFWVTTLIWVFKYDYSAAFNMFLILEPLVGKWAVGLIFFSLFIISLMILFRFSPVWFTRKVASAGSAVSELKDTFKKEKETFNSSPSSKKSIKADSKVDSKQKELDDMMESLKKEKEALAKQRQKQAQLNLSDAPKKIKIENKSPSKLKSLFSKEEKTTDKPKIIWNDKFSKWEFPTLDLLKSRKVSWKVDEHQIREKEIEIQEKLLQFKIEVEMQWYRVWPTVIQYRLKPKSGVKLQKIVNLQSDLALALHAKSIRIQAPIPGLGVVGIEVPNPKREAVWLKDVLESKEFNSKKYEIPLALWRDVSGNIMIGDMATMPHLLIAGQTGSGKSVWMNGFLMSLLYKFSPSELKMIMVDPKRVELSVYNGIPHLLTPVITNPDKALNSLKWCVAEMLRRYDLATQMKARNLTEYNEKVDKEDKLPYIVFVIDELADLMMSGNKKEVETSIARIAQMARAVGMHLIVATQRPSVDVITGLIKANIPSRVAFTVASQIDSQTILSQKGAEDLLGRGDMLYYPTGQKEPERVQWVFVETSEVEAVVNKLKLTVDPDMLKNMQDPAIAEWRSKTEGSILENYKGDQEEDPAIIEKAIAVVSEAKKWSTSLVQRKLWLWYARAAKVLDILEELWVVGPANGSKPREVYVD